MRAYLDEVELDDIKQRFEAFWKREPLNKPICYITAPREKHIEINFPTAKSIEERWINIEYVLKKIEHYFENTKFLGDAIPWYLPNLGPNSFSAFLGANLKFISDETSWAEPFIDDISRYHPEFREDNKWWRIMSNLLDDICGVAEGNFLVGIPDIHYGGDSLAALLGTRNLVRSLYTKPNEVKKLIGELTKICLEVFERYYQRISRVQRGSITWIPAYSKGRYFALQDDFSGLVSPKMFEEFFLEEQVTLANSLNNSIFHLDGPMALGNLDYLLKIESLNGIQWVPGAGSKPMSEWINVCLKVLKNNKCLVVECKPEEVEIMLSKLSYRGLMLCIPCRSEKEAKSVLKIIDRHSGIKGEK
ncbi:MAG: hypothetical protein QXK89_09800 [Candidatus Bathyarchaeia archaeon]